MVDDGEAGGRKERKRGGGEGGRGVTRETRKPLPSRGYEEGEEEPQIRGPRKLMNERTGCKVA